MIIVTGSYNGQDSLGDECLLRAVVEQIRVRYQGTVVLHVHGLSSPFLKSICNEYHISARQGLQSKFFKINHYLNRARVYDYIPKVLIWLLTIISSPKIIVRILLSNAYIVFGGTQFSGQWYTLNSPFYYAESRLTSLFFGKIFYNTQQFGPLAAVHSAQLRKFLSKFVTEWRTRNINDLSLFLRDRNSVNSDKYLLYDEVFSNVRLYPNLERAKSEYILVNLRNTNFTSDALITKDKLDPIVELIKNLSDFYSLPVKFFSVSDSTFCDDNSQNSYILEQMDSSSDNKNFGRVSDEYQLFRIARHAKLVLSMSFHGCILGGISGVPFIPISDGKYYDYKYSDFDKYSGYQNIPIVALASANDQSIFSQIIQYVESYQPSKFHQARVEASALMDSYYDSIFYNHILK